MTPNSPRSQQILAHGKHRMLSDYMFRAVPEIRAAFTQVLTNVEPKVLKASNGELEHFGILIEASAIGSIGQWKTQ